MTGMNDQYPAENGEALTAVALLCRFFLGQNPDDNPVMKDHAELLLRDLPEWDGKDGYTNDMYYWYYGSYAMFQMGGKKGGEGYWKKSLETAVLRSQRKDGSSKGSWDPNGPWGYAGGRVYSTATMVLCLEAYYRYARVLGALIDHPRQRMIHERQSRPPARTRAGVLHRGPALLRRVGLRCAGPLSPAP